MADNVTKLTNREARARAAVMVADDDLPDVEIAAAVGVSVRTLHRWKREPEFAALVGDHIGQIQASMLKLTIAKKHKRLEVLDDLHTRQLSVIRLRAERYAASADTPAAAAQKVFGTHPPPEAVTGLMVKKETMTGGGGSTVEWTFDASLVKEIRATHEQAAKELGQWTERSEISGQVSVVRIVGADVEAL